MIRYYPWRWCIRDLMQSLMCWFLLYWFMVECLLPLLPS